MTRVSKRPVSRREKGEQTPAFLQHMGIGLHAETGCRKVYAGVVFEEQKIPKAMEALRKKKQEQ